MRSDQINELMGALAKAQGEMSAAAKDCNNPFFKSKYADLNSIWMACREPLSKNGLAVTQIMVEVGDNLYLETLLGHSSGQYISSKMPIKIKSDAKNNELQVLGSCLTYLRRYALAAIVGVAPDEDDDGNAGKGYQASKQDASAAPTIPVITSSQARDLVTVLAEVSPEHREHFNAYLRENKVPSIAQIPATWFPEMKKVLDSQKLEWKEKANVGTTGVAK